MNERQDERPVAPLPIEPIRCADDKLDRPILDLERPGSGLTMIAGDSADGVCEGDACVVPWITRNDDAG